MIEPPPLVSIVLVVKNQARTISTCIDAVRKQTYPHIEFIAVDNNSTDGTAEILRSTVDTFVSAGPERSAQRNIGLQHARGKYVFFIDSDMYLTPHLISEAVGMMESGHVDTLFIPEETIAEGFWGKCKKFERDFYMAGDPSAEAPRFFITSHVRQIGGYNESLVGGEDWELGDRYLSHYPRVSRTSATLIHDEGYVRLDELLRKKAYYIRTGMNDYLREAPAYRRIPYPFRPSVRRQWYRFLKHPILGVGSIGMKFLEAIPLLKLKVSAKKRAS